MEANRKQLLERIVVDPQILVGKPVVRGTRIPVYLFSNASRIRLTSIHSSPITLGPRLKTCKPVLPMRRELLLAKMSSRFSLMR
jgi:hypothetical protein